MKTLLLAALVIGSLSSPTTALGRIGESMDECKARYGEPVGEDNDVIQIPNSKLVVFMKAGLAVGVTLIDGRAAMINFQKVKKDSLGTPEPISDTEIDALLAANAVGKWRAVDSPVGKKQWMSEDGKYFGQQHLVRPSLTIMSRAFDKALVEAAQKKGEIKLEGF
jgi:hypothetical protein